MYKTFLLMGEIRKTVLVMGMLALPFLCIAQTAANAHTDSLLSQDVPNAVKAARIENYLNSLPQETPTLEDAYYAFARWSWVHNDDPKRAQQYGKKERALRLRKYADTADKTKKNLYNLAFFHTYADVPDYWTAKAYLDTLLTVSEGSETRTGTAYRELGNLYNHWGDFQNALEHYQQSQRILSNSDRPDYELITHNNILANYVDLNDGDYLNEFMSTLQKIENLKNVEISPLRQAKILYNTAAMYQISDRWDEAETYALKALPIFKRIDAQDDVFNSLSLLGVIEIQKGNPEKAKGFLKNAATYADGNRLLLSNVSNNMGDLELRSGNYEKAIGHYFDAISWVTYGSPSHGNKTLPQEAEVSISPDKKRLFGYLNDLAQAWMAYYDKNKNPAYLGHAKNTLALADMTIDELFLESREVISKLNWREKASKLYMDAIKVAYLNQEPHLALYYMEKKKGLLLLENTVEVLAKQRAHIPRTTLEKEEAMLQAIKEGEAEVGSISREQNLEAAKKKLFSLKKHYRKFVDSLETLYPAYVSSKKQLNISTFNDVRKGIKEKEYVISYAIGDSLGYVLAISKESVQFRQIPVAIPILKEHIADFHQQLLQPFGTSEDVLAYKTTAKQLFDILLPFEIFGQKTPQKSITIIPDGIIQKVPFEALITQDNATLPDAYLISKHTIAYQYSHSLDTQMAQLSGTVNPNLTSFYPVQFKNRYLGELPSSLKESDALKDYFGDRAFTKTNATKDAFLVAFHDNSVVHISTHGGTDAQGPWLAFYDSKLRLDELYLLKNRKEMVVLSACKTDVGDNKEGEGVFSIKRGFFKAGARSVLSTLWDVNEKSSYEITTLFYEGIASGSTKSVALRDAKLEYLRKNGNTSEASPYYWSALTLTGFDGPVDLGMSSHSGLFWVAIPVILLLLILWMMVRKRAR